VRQHFVAHVAAVDVEQLRVGACAGGGRQADPAGQAQPGGLGQYLAVRAGKLVGQELEGALARPCRRQRKHAAALVHEVELDLRVGRGDALDLGDAVAELGGLAAQELAPRRRAKEQVRHLDARAHRAGGRLRYAAGTIDLKRRRTAGRARDNAQRRHGGDRGQGLAAEAQRGHRLQFGQRGDLAAAR